MAQTRDIKTRKRRPSPHQQLRPFLLRPFLHLLRPRKKPLRPRRTHQRLQSSQNLQWVEFKMLRITRFLIFFLFKKKTGKAKAKEINDENDSTDQTSPNKKSGLSSEYSTFQFFLLEVPHLKLIRLWDWKQISESVLPHGKIIFL